MQRCSATDYTDFTPLCFTVCLDKGNTQREGDFLKLPVDSRHPFAGVDGKLRGAANRLPFTKIPGGPAAALCAMCRLDTIALKTRAFSPNVLYLQ